MYDILCYTILCFVFLLGITSATNILSSNSVWLQA